MARETLVVVSIPESGVELAEDSPPESFAAHDRRDRVNQPWRAAVAGVEWVVAVGLLFAAWWLWGKGFVHIELPGLYGTTDVVTRLIGSWLAMSILSGAVAGLLLLDSVRQLMLAWAVRGQRARRKSDVSLAEEV